MCAVRRNFLALLIFRKQKPNILRKNWDESKTIKGLENKKIVDKFIWRFIPRLCFWFCSFLPTSNFQIAKEVVTKFCFGYFWERFCSKSENRVTVNHSHHAHKTSNCFSFHRVDENSIYVVCRCCSGRPHCRHRLGGCTRTATATTIRSQTHSHQTERT